MRCPGRMQAELIERARDDAGVADGWAGDHGGGVVAVADDFLAGADVTAGLEVVRREGTRAPGFLDWLQDEGDGRRGVLGVEGDTGLELRAGFLRASGRSGACADRSSARWRRASAGAPARGEAGTRGVREGGNVGRAPVRWAGAADVRSVARGRHRCGARHLAHALALRCVRELNQGSSRTRVECQAAG